MFGRLMPSKASWYWQSAVVWATCKLWINGAIYGYYRTLLGTWPRGSESTMTNDLDLPFRCHFKVMKVKTFFTVMLLMQRLSSCSSYCLLSIVQVDYDPWPSVNFVGNFKVTNLKELNLFNSGECDTWWLRDININMTPEVRIYHLTLTLLPLRLEVVIFRSQKWT